MDIRRQASPLVPPVQACVVGRTVDPDPVGLVDPTAVAAGRTRGERSRDLDAAALLTGDRPDLVRNLREVLTLARIQPGVVLPAGAMRMMSSSTRTSIPVSSRQGVAGAVGELHGLVPAAKRPTTDVNVLRADRPECPFREGMPDGCRCGAECPCRSESGRAVSRARRTVGGRSCGRYSRAPLVRHGIGSAHR